MNMRSDMLSLLQANGSEQSTADRYQNKSTCICSTEIPGITIMIAKMEHLSAAKLLSDQHKRELGFINQAILQKAIEARLLLIALRDGYDEQAEHELVGLAHFYVRRDQIITLYSIVVDQAYQRTGLGRLLFVSLVNEARIRGKNEICLKCPEELPANIFYERLGLQKVSSEPGKLRTLNIWKYTLGAS
jgi:GNAT superfamily N-acetyltransferase